MDEDDEAGGAGEVFEIEVAGRGEVDGFSPRGTAAGVGSAARAATRVALKGMAPVTRPLRRPLFCSKSVMAGGIWGLVAALAGGGEEFGRVAAEELGLAMDYGLGGVDAVEGEALAVALLAGGERGGGGGGVGPAEAIPVVGVLAEDEEFDAGDSVGDWSSLGR